MSSTLRVFCLLAVCCKLLVRRSSCEHNASCPGEHDPVPSCNAHFRRYPKRISEIRRVRHCFSGLSAGHIRAERRPVQWGHSIHRQRQRPHDLFDEGRRADCGSFGRPRGEENTLMSIGLRGAAFSWNGKEKLVGRSNYFVGNNPRKWRRNVPHLARVEALQVAKGVDMVLYGNNEGAEYDLRIAPGAEASNLRLAIKGAERIRLTNTGDLSLRVGAREIRMRKPQIFEEPRSSQNAAERSLVLQRLSTVRNRVRGGYRMESDGSVGFWVGQHDASSTLVLDPSLSVAYSAFLGGTGTDAANSVALDSLGNVYVSGTTTSAGTFPEGSSAVMGPGVASGASTSQFFIAKINPAVSGAGSLTYLTFLGGKCEPNGSGARC